MLNNVQMGFFDDEDETLEPVESFAVVKVQGEPRLATIISIGSKVITTKYTKISNTDAGELETHLQRFSA